MDGSTTAGYLDEILLEGIPFEVIDHRYWEPSSVFYVSPRVLAGVIFHLGRLTAKRREDPMSFSRRLWVSYCLACLDVIKPKVVLDYVHLPNMIHLAREFPSAQYFVIQNGFCADALDFLMDGGAFRKIFHYVVAEMHPKTGGNVHFFYNGPKDIEIFEQAGLATAVTGIAHHASGPLKADYFRHEKLPKTPITTNDFDICLCSQAGSSHIEANSEFSSLLMASNDLLTAYLRRYIESRNLRCAVAPRTSEIGADTISPELDYLRARMGTGPLVSIVPREDYLSTYRLIARSEVIVAVNSSAGFDAISLGKKVLFAPFYLYDVYRISSSSFVSDEDMWKWMVVKPDYAEFEMKLDALRATPRETYLAEMKTRAAALSNFGNPMPAHKYIRGMIDSFIRDSSVDP